MFLSNIDIVKALKNGALTIEPFPVESNINETSVDLRLDRVEEARIWDISKHGEESAIRGDEPNELKIGRFDYRRFSQGMLIPPPGWNRTESPLVSRRGIAVIVKPHGFLLWQTKEVVGSEKGTLICFVEGKSTRARTGILVHLTAPTIHAGWKGKITLEIVNLGPFDLVLHEDDVIAQLTVAQVARKPSKTGRSATNGQIAVTGGPNASPVPRKRFQSLVSKRKRR